MEIPDLNSFDVNLRLIDKNNHFYSNSFLKCVRMRRFHHDIEKTCY